MDLADLNDWIADYIRPQYLWYVKRLSGNDTLANGSHQAGPYIPKPVAFRVLPDLYKPDLINPDVLLNLYIDSHHDHRQARAIWYNNKTRNEARITRLGGLKSALLDPENTGALAIFVFTIEGVSIENSCHVWVCEHELEEDLIEAHIGPVEPRKDGYVFTFDETSLKDTQVRPSTRSTCWLAPSEIPSNWLNRFPSGMEIIEKTLELWPDNGINPDKRLIQRRDCEFILFQSLESAIELPRIQQGFEGVNEFINHAQTILQRRKSRSGRSLELHTRAIFLEEGLNENIDFSWQPKTEDDKKPDFIFPSVNSYKNINFPDSKLRMLAVKTTCKDRWRQILNEADRIRNKHLFTLQEGVSQNQFNEMKKEGVQLVVPEPLINSYPPSVRPHLQTLESFIGDVRLLRM
jgi:hypothetical protein